MRGNYSSTLSYPIYLTPVSWIFAVLVDKIKSRLLQEEKSFSFLIQTHTQTHETNTTWIPINVFCVSFCLGFQIWWRKISGHGHLLTSLTWASCLVNAFFRHRWYWPVNYTTASDNLLNSLRLLLTGQECHCHIKHLAKTLKTLSAIFY